MWGGIPWNIVSPTYIIMDMNNVMFNTFYPTNT